MASNPSLFRRFVTAVAMLLPLTVLLPGAEPTAGAEAGVAMDQPWDIAGAIDRAMQANPDLVSARLEAEREQGGRLQVRARLMPRVSASASLDERQDSLIDRSPGEFTLPPTQRSAVAKWGYDVRVEVRQLLFDGFSTLNAMERQKLRHRQALLRVTEVANEVITAVRQTYDAILVRRMQLEAERRRVEDLTKLADYASRKQALGEIGELDQLNANSLLQIAKAEMSEIERDLTITEQQFVRLLRLPAAAGPLRLAQDFKVRQFELSYGQAVAIAFENRPDLEAANLAVEASKRQQYVLNGEYLPRFDAFASWANRSSYYSASRSLEGWTIGAVGSWNIFDGGDLRGRRRTAIAERRIAETKLQELELQVGSRMRELYQGLEHSREAMSAQDTARQFAARAFQAARRLYENGQASLEKVLQAQMISRQAENSYLDAAFRYNATVAQIEQAMGNAQADPAAWKR